MHVLRVHALQTEHASHNEQIEEWATDIFKCSPPPVFQPNGGTVPDWSHLLLSEQEFFDMLSATSLGTCKGLVRQTTDFVYKCVSMRCSRHSTRGCPCTSTLQILTLVIVQVARLEPAHV